MFYKLFNAHSTIFLFVRSSHQEVFCKKGVLRNFEKLTRKHLCGSLFFDKVAGLNLIKKKTLAQVFSCQFCEISKNTFSYRRPPVAAADFFKCLFVTSHTLPPPLLYSEVLFLFLILYLGAPFYKKKKEKRKKYL